MCTRSLELKWAHKKCLAVKRAGTKGFTLSWGGGGGGGGERAVKSFGLGIFPFCTHPPY